MLNHKKIGIDSIIYASMITCVIFVVIIFSVNKQEISIGRELWPLGWNLWPYLFFYFIFKKVDEDKFMIYHLVALLLSIGSGLLLLIVGALIGHDPFIPLIVPIYQFYAYIILYLIIKFVRKFTKKK